MTAGTTQVGGRVGIVGTGHRARLYTSAVAARPDTSTIVALCDTNAERMAVHNRILEELGCEHAKTFDAVSCARGEWALGLGGGVGGGRLEREGWRRGCCVKGGGVGRAGRRTDGEDRRGEGQAEVRGEMRSSKERDIVAGEMESPLIDRGRG